MNLQAILDNPIVQDIISEIMAHCEDQTSHEDDYGWLADTIKGLSVIDRGETKTVLIYQDWDFVIKIPNYYAYSDYDYCKLEEEKYQSAKKFGVEKLLLETAYLITAGCIDLYVQPRFSCAATEPQSMRKAARKTHNLENKKIIRRVAHTTYDGYRIDSIWLARALQLYGKKFFLRFEKWSHENQVGDLHRNNVGWLKGKPIILDYSGYYG